jgi:VWFA-related protein
MPRLRVAVAAVGLLAGIGNVNLAGQARAPQRERQSYTSAATAILVDVVVRDRKGHPVMDLSAEDFQLAEDGVAQRVDSFTRVSHGSGIGVGIAWKTPDKTAVRPGGAEPAAPASEAEPEEASTALVFDHLSSESLRLAQKATLDYVPKNGDSGVRVAIFASDPGIRVVQRFTTDRSLLRKAVEHIVPSGTTAEEQKTDRQDELVARRRDLQGQNEAVAAGAVTGASAAMAQNAAELGERENELRLIQTELNMIRSFDNLDRDHRGYDTVLALLAVVQSLSAYPGRKTIVFFSEGLPVSPVLSARLDYVIDFANRANITAYTVDAKGLRAKSTLTAARKEMEAFVDERFTQVAAGSDRSNQPLTMGFERVEDTLKLDSRAGLARLAADTGGFLVEQSNSLSAAFRRIDEDNQFHYLLTYSPTNTEFDGKFRAIQVKVHRPGVQVFARKGYRAIRAPGAIDAGSYDAPALAMLDRTPLPNAFPVHAAGFSFPDPARPGLTPVLVHLSTDALRFNVDPNRATYSAQAAVVVRIRDAQGHDVQRLSQQYVLSGDAKDVEAAKKGDIIFYREPQLPAGVYTLETIVFDAMAREGSARVATLTVPAADKGAIGMSSLVLVSRVEQVNNVDSSVGAPLYVGKSLLYPNLGQPIQKSVTSELPFYFALYGAAHDAKAVAQLVRNGQTVAEAPVELPPAIGTRVQQVGRLPIGALPAGTYELRIRVTASGQELTRAAFFTLQN